MIVATLAASPVLAQSGIQVPPVEVHRLFSKAVGDSFEIQVLLPPKIPGETTRFPVVYMTDVYGSFLFEDGLRMLMLGDTPRFIAVGIGYPGAKSILHGIGKRARDLTQVPVKDANPGAVMPIDGLLQPADASGGASSFLAFIRDELIPFVDARYPTDPKDRGYWGDSLGGLFGCYVLFTQPETFNRYVIGSPSIWWADEEVLQRAERYLSTHDDIRAKVFLGVGGLEEVGDGARFRMVTNTLRVERMLRAKDYPGLQVTSRVFPDESHITVFGMNLVRGLVSVFGPTNPQDALFAKYAEMAKQSSKP